MWSINEIVADKVLVVPESLQESTESLYDTHGMSHFHNFYMFVMTNDQCCVCVVCINIYWSEKAFRVIGFAVSICEYSKK